MSTTTPLADPHFAEPATRRQIEAVVKGLEARNVGVHVVDTVGAARTLVGELLPTDEEIFTAQSQTLQLSGIASDIDDPGRFRSLRATRLAALQPWSAEGSSHYGRDLRADPGNC